MILVILALAAGCIPSLILFFWFRNALNKENDLYKKNCDRMLGTGFLTVFPVMLFSLCTVIIFAVTRVKTTHPVLHAALSAFLTASLSEELCKFYMFRRRLKNIEGEHSWLDLIIYSTIVGIGFGLFESVVYVLDSGPLVMLIRGLSIPHGGYAAIVGYFYARSLKDNKKVYTVLGILIAFLLHGLYDFSLSKEIETITDVSGLIAVNLALLDVVIIIVLVIFIRRKKNNPKYTEPLCGTAVREKDPEA